MLTILCHLAGQSQCHTQPVRHRYNVGFKHSILKTLSVLSTNRGTEGMHHLKTWFITVLIFMSKML